MKEHLDKHERCKKCYHLSSCNAWVEHGTTLYDDYEFSVEDCPYFISAEDVAEVRHAKWVTDKGTFDLCGVEFYNCSVCGGQTQVKYPNCPWCIAKMDGGNKDG